MHRIAFLFAFLPLIAFSQNASPILSLPEMPEPTYTEDSSVKEGVPQGKVTRHEWRDSKVFPGTVREYSIYVPAQYDGSKETAVMIFQDGHSYLNPKGEFRATIVMDNLIHAGTIPPMIGIFINPGHLEKDLPKEPWKSSNRSFEYDTLSGDYAKFLLDEILPEVSKTYKLTTDPDQRAVAGSSSGGICAWTVAWQRPDAFRKVFSAIGSFTNIRGGDVYPGLIRKTEKKPIRAVMQEGINDLDNPHGSWPLANMQMEAALKFASYDYQYFWDHGQHNGKSVGPVFPEMMRWLWRK